MVAQNTLELVNKTSEVLHIRRRLLTNVSMEIKPIKNNRDYREALKEIDRLMDARPKTAEGDRLDVLVTLVEAWEEKHWPIGSPDPVEAILFAMEHRGLSRRDLEPLIGSREHVWRKC